MELREYVSFVLALTCFKLLLIPGYKSGDFEVHRNWIAVTHSLPMNEWYTNSVSQWTLDYPPFFAYLEYLLSFVAVRVDPLIARISKEEYGSVGCVVFQRLTVIVSDLLFAVVVYFFTQHFRRQFVKKKIPINPSYIIPVGLLLNTALIVVDNIHFFYNSLLFSIFLASVLSILKKKYLLGAALFAVVINFKHIFIYAGFCYFIFLLRKYCFVKSRFVLSRFLSLAGITILIFLLSFGPFILYGQIPQVLGRLFPFKRGLLHAYWAGNFWALYSFADKALRCFLSPRMASLNKSALGITQETGFDFLPQVTPAATVGCVLLLLVPLAACVWKNPRRCFFPYYLAYAIYVFFMFSYQVHEKALLMVVLIYTSQSFNDNVSNEISLLLRISAGVSTFPLLTRVNELPIKYLLFAVDMLIYVWIVMGSQFGAAGKRKTVVLAACGGALAVLLGSVYWVNIFVLGGRLPFAQEMLTSVSCACINVYTFVRMLAQLLRLYRQRSLCIKEHISQHNKS